MTGEEHFARHRSRPRYVDEPDYGEAVEALVACEHKEVEGIGDGRIHIVGNHLLGLGKHWAECFLVNTVECH